MKTIITNVYQFEELNEAGKQKAIETNYFINIDADSKWWRDVYSDAENVGIKITDFDLDPCNSITIEFEVSELTTVELIIANWGEDCEGVKECKEFLRNYDLIGGENYDSETATEDEHDKVLEAIEMLEDDFKMTLERVFLNLLESDYEYRTSEPAIIETFKANDYHFTSDGIMRNS